MVGDAGALRLTLERLQVVASRRRLRILRALADRRRTVAELERALDVNRGTLHDHLQRLADAGFVHRDADDERRWVHYELTADGRRLAEAPRVRILVELGLGVLLAGAGAAAFWVVWDPLEVAPRPGEPVGVGGPGLLAWAAGAVLVLVAAALLLDVRNQLAPGDGG